MFALTLALATIVLTLATRFGAAGLRRLARLPLRAGWLPPLAACAQIVGLVAEPLRPSAMAVTIALIAGFCIANRRVGMLTAGIGAALNLLVMAANGGLMPVQPELVQRSHGVAVAVGAAVPFSKNIALPDAQAALALLADRFVLPGPLQHLAIWSLGDAILLAGVAYTLYTVMRGTPHAGLRPAAILEPS